MIDTLRIVRHAHVAGRAGDAKGDDGAGAEFLFDGRRAFQADSMDAGTMKRESGGAQGTDTPDKATQRRCSE
jgi:hypothetical protein